MGLKSKNNWSNMPKHIITSIGSYLPFHFKIEIRSLNKHWSKSINSLVFYSVNNFKSEGFNQIIEKYGVYVKRIDDTSLRLLSIQKLIQLCPKIDHLFLNIVPSNLNTIIQLIEALPLVSKIDIDWFIDYDSKYDSELSTIVTLISQLKNLKCILFYLFEPNEALLQKFYNLKLNSISVISQWPNFGEFKKFYSKFHSISKLYYSFDCDDRDADEEMRQNLVTPNFLLSYNTLKVLTIWINLYIDNEGPVGDYLSKELLDLFNNPKFNNLTNFEWMYYTCGNLRASAVFASQIPKTCHWINLNRLALFFVDEHLLTYIIQHCPNLVEFCIDSALTLPTSNNFMDLIPMKKLKRLHIRGFHKLAIKNEHIFVHLFPNVTTLNFCLDRDTLSEGEISADAYYIPRLFPCLTRTILKSSDIQLSNLINKYEDSVNWEELYIQLTDGSSILLDSLLSKLLRLKLLYIYISSPEIQLPRNYNNIRVFSVDHISGTEFTFTIEKELVQEA